MFQDQIQPHFTICPIAIESPIIIRIHMFLIVIVLILIPKIQRIMIPICIKTTMHTEHRGRFGHEQFLNNLRNRIRVQMLEQDVEKPYPPSSMIRDILVHIPILLLHAVHVPAWILLLFVSIRIHIRIRGGGDSIQMIPVDISRERGAFFAEQHGEYLFKVSSSAIV